MKRIICALLAVLTALSLFAACVDTKKTTAAQTGPAKTGGSKVTDPNLDEWGREKVASAIPEGKKFGGEQVNIVLDNYYWRKTEFYAEALTGDLINDAVYNRNLKIENELGVKLNFIDLQVSPLNFASAVARTILSGTGDYDILSGYAYQMTGPVRSWAYANLKEIEEESSMDLTKPWWNQSYVKECTVYGQLYTVTGDLAYSTIATAQCMFFNKRLADEYLAAWGGTDGLYKLVEDYQWTMDKFSEICKNIYNDKDGDGQRSEGDFYAFASWWSGPTPADSFQYGMDARITRTDENGVPYLDFYNDKAVKVIEKLISFNGDNAGVLYNKDYYNKGEKDLMIRDKFRNGELIFTAYYLNAATWFTEMNDNFGILPMPMFDEAQHAYYTSQDEDYSVFAIAADVLDRGKADIVGTTLEMLNEESYRSVAPNYYETVMKYRYLRTDAQNQKDILMYDYIVKGNTFDFGMVFSAALDDIGFAYRHIIGGGQAASLQTYWQGKETVVRTRFESLIEDLSDQ